MAGELMASLIKLMGDSALAGTAAKGTMDMNKKKEGNKAILDDWIVSQGYSITTILSANQLNKLLNGKQQKQTLQNKGFDKQSLNDKDFFSDN